MTRSTTTPHNEPALAARRDYRRLIAAARAFHRALRNADSLYDPHGPKTVEAALDELKEAALAVGPPLGIH